MTQLREREEFLGIVLGYHLGLNDAAGRPEPGDVGGLGGTMCLAFLAAQVANATPAQAVTTAAAMELAKDVTQLQDDILDEDRLRREKPSAWTVFGIARTLLAADAAKAAAFDLLDDGSAHAPAALRHLRQALDLCGVGQAQDIAAEHRPLLGPQAMWIADFRRIATNKTCSLLACTYSLGAVFAGAQQSLIDGLIDVGRSLGMALQVLDDVLDLWGPLQDNQRRPYSDLRQGKKTFPLLTALTADTQASSELLQLLADTPLAENDLPRAAELIYKAGGRAASVTEVHRAYSAALTALEALALSSPASHDLVAVSSLIGLRGPNQTVSVSFPALSTHQPPARIRLPNRWKSRDRP
ncbi:polyprenyl synthetase family protein [Nocardia brasiliensis]|uniref:polyprenyl synthetase family protein n=1 Tax=Nocardia brasiliensis TaxID=37326 RepID=UPI0037BCD5B6